jgi:hypothetical protein
VAVGESAPRDDDRHAVIVAQLTLGTLAGPVVADDWSAILARAIRERCASLAWHRSASVIRARASAAVADAWRRHAIEAVEVAQDMSAELAAAHAVLGGASASPIVLKGLPLAVRLYGEPWVRPSSDMDLYVPVESRRACHRALLAAGWRHLDGVPPAESTYERRDGIRVMHLELHSSLFDDNILSHIVAPHPEAIPVDVGGTALFALTGPLEPIFLATHLAKHARVALLWWIDFASLWKSTPAARRDVTRSLARQLRLDRYLAWAEAGAALVEIIGQGGAPAQPAYQRLRAMHGAHNVRRVLALAAGLRDKWRVLAAWAWPVAYRGRPLPFAISIVRRVHDRVRRRTTSRQTADLAGTPARSLSVDSPEFVALVRAVIAEGGALWVRIHGTSMIPSIPRDAAVLLAPIEEEGVLVGDVLLAELPDGRSVLHRVVAVTATTVVLKGDNLPAVDAPLPLDRVVAVARVVETGGARVALSRRPVRTLRSMVSRLRRRMQHA